jgi:hypothetical protein
VRFEQGKYMHQESSKLRRYALVIFLCLNIMLPLRASPITEYEVKAAFLFNLTSFILWPEDEFSHTFEFYLCVLGHDPFGELLDLVVAGLSVKQRPIKIQRFTHIQECEQCHILFISTSEKANLNAIFTHLEHMPVLTVSDITRFSHQGGMIEFFLHQKKIRLALNLDNILRTGLKASSQLIQVSEIISTQP